MPSSPFRDEVERQRALTVALDVLAGMTMNDDVGSCFVEHFDRLYPVVDAPEDTTRSGRWSLVLPDAPTPPDFDAAVDDLEDALYFEHCGRTDTQAGAHEKAVAARQRVRELHEAVERERDEALAAMNADVADVVLALAALRTQHEVVVRERDAAKANTRASHEAMASLLSNMDALRAAQQGEVGTVIGAMDVNTPDWIALPEGHDFSPGDTVRVTRVEEAP